MCSSSASSDCASGPGAHLAHDQLLEGRLLGDAAREPQRGDAGLAIALVGEVVGDDGGRLGDVARADVHGARRVRPQHERADAEARKLVELDAVGMARVGGARDCASGSSRRAGRARDRSWRAHARSPCMPPSVAVAGAPGSASPIQALPQRIGHDVVQGDRPRALVGDARVQVVAAVLADARQVARPTGMPSSAQARACRRCRRARGSAGSARRRHETITSRAARGELRSSPLLRYSTPTARPSSTRIVRHARAGAQCAGCARWRTGSR